MTGSPEPPGQGLPDEGPPDRAGDSFPGPSADAFIEAHRDGDLTGRFDDDGGPDSLEVLLRPHPEFLAAPAGAFDRIRRRAGRRRRARAAVGGGAAVAVLAGTLYLVGSLTDGSGDEVVGPPASSATTTSPSPAPTGSTGRPVKATPSTGATTAQQPSAGPSDSGTPSAPAGAPTGSATGASTTTPSAPQGATPMCATSQLIAKLVDGGVGAGNLYLTLVLTNHSATACHVNGYPGLSLLDSGGKQIGVPATRDGRAHQEVVLAPGGSASDTVHTANQQGTCQTPSARLRIYPPGNRASLEIPGQITVCDNLFTVTPFAAGATGNPPS